MFVGSQSLACLIAARRSDAVMVWRSSRAPRPTLQQPRARTAAIGIAAIGVRTTNVAVQERVHGVSRRTRRVSADTGYAAITSIKSIIYRWLCGCCPRPRHQEDDMTTRMTTWILAMTTAAAFVGRTAAADETRAAEGTAPATRRIVVSIPDRKLALVENDAVVTIYPIAVGAPVSPSPVGTFSVVTRVANPTYYKPGEVVGPGATNPIGTRWIGLSAKGFGIHGTDNPGSIGHAKSHGCIRLRNQDVERLFERVRPGDVVELYDEPPDDIAQLFDEWQ